MDTKTLHKANQLSGKSDQASRVLNELEDFKNIKYISFESIDGKTIRLSALLNSSIASELFEQIKGVVRGLQSRYDNEFKQL